MSAFATTRNAKYPGVSGGPTGASVFLGLDRHHSGPFSQDESGSPQVKRPTCLRRRPGPFRKHADSMEYAQDEFGERCFRRASQNYTSVLKADLICGSADGV